MNDIKVNEAFGLRIIFIGMVPSSYLLLIILRDFFLSIHHLVIFLFITCTNNLDYSESD